jgi:hypothetical protein
MRLTLVSAAALVCAVARPAPAADPLPQVGAADPALRIDGSTVSWRGKPFTGRVVAHDPSGAARTSTPYLRGRRDGVARAWYADGRPAYERAFRDGREEGVHRAWWQNGRPWLAERFRDGRLEGTVREWFENGRLYREVRYHGGEEAGLQRMWYADGTLRASYVVRDGRRFGLMGAKGCTGEHNGLAEDADPWRGSPQAADAQASPERAGN